MSAARAWWQVGVSLAMGLGLLLPVPAQQRPLVTERVATVPEGELRIDLGFEFAQTQRFPLSGLRGDLSRMGVLGLSLGVAPRVELQLRGTIQNYLSIDERRGGAISLRLPTLESTHDVGDFSLWTKVQLRAAEGRWPALGVRVGVELPNSDQARGIGTNQTNFFAAVLAEKQWGDFDLFGHIGVGILPAPIEPFVQNDVLLYGLAGVYELNARTHLVAEVSGWENTRRRAPLGTESRGQMRIGLQLRTGRLWWDLAGVRGVHAIDPRSGIIFGVSTTVPLWKR
ncbi:MAG: hypothetical protein N0A16_06745 [Blastocatellia bacterium]|nr:hypothetical protein [Blastocatellia bacterium]MCS7157407.1 hypothetical protein [Blastocatellia bacterium]MCX7752581.1 hypothetical protein [Blastocatellia bacterium]MDW8168312.1 hypothetical protein [Acidobacteriota bacterium]MDW8255508.1 hypothetical protein [Acidobacteriota bacterium]